MNWIVGRTEFSVKTEACSRGQTRSLGRPWEWARCPCSCWHSPLASFWSLLASATIPHSIGESQTPRAETKPHNIGVTSLSCYRRSSRLAIRMVLKLLSFYRHCWPLGPWGVPGTNHAKLWSLPCSWSTAFSWKSVSLALTSMPSFSADHMPPKGG